MLSVQFRAGAPILSVSTLQRIGAACTDEYLLSNYSSFVMHLATKSQYLTKALRLRHWYLTRALRLS